MATNIPPQSFAVSTSSPNLSRGAELAPTPNRCALAWVPNFLRDFGAWLFSALQTSWSWTVSSCSCVVNLLYSVLSLPGLLFSLDSQNRSTRLTSENSVPATISQSTTNQMMGLRILENQNISTLENRDAVITSSVPLDMAAALKTLNERGILITPEIRTVLRTNNDPIKMTSVLTPLQRHGILTLENIEAVTTSPLPDHMTAALDVLNQRGILTPEVRTALRTARDPARIVPALEQLEQFGILNTENITAVATAAEPAGELSCYLTALHEAGILTPEIREALRTSLNREPLFRNYRFTELNVALSMLHEDEILTPENRDAVQRSPVPILLASVLKQVKSDPILTVLEDREALIASNEPFWLCLALFQLIEEGILTSENRELTVHSKSPGDRAYNLVQLHKAAILISPEIRKALSIAVEPDELQLGLLELQKANLLTPENEKSILSASDPLYFAISLRRDKTR